MCMPYIEFWIFIQYYFQFFLFVIVSSVSGQYLKFTNITRNQMAAYTCYADNGLAPVANATFLLEVHCK